MWSCDCSCLCYVLFSDHVVVFQKYGDQSSGLGDKSRKITVFLNPASRGGSAALFSINLFFNGLEHKMCGQKIFSKI